ncbi:MAG: SPASM domain-containing protein, partial [Candidatus Aminicenantes bacterium]|nr:SPASM domain-containing protein [Candidatus Aminicenantes bacterium]
RAWELFEELSGIDSRDFRSSWRAHPPWAARSCNRLPYSLAVRAEGTVTPCLGLDLPVGHVRDAALGEIFSRSAVMDDLRDVRARVKGYCRICRKAGVCYGCRASAYHRTGDHLASDPECWHRRIPDEGEKRIPVEGNIPQKGSMELIRGWAIKDDLKAILPLTVPGEGIFIAPDRTLAPVALIEMLAQHCAAGSAPQKEAGHDGQLRGYMAGIDNVSFFHPVRSGDSLDLVICNIIEFNEIHRVQGEVFRGSALVGQAELTLIEVGEWKAPPPKAVPSVQPAADPSMKRFREAMSDKDPVGRGILDSLTGVTIKPGEMAEADLSFKPEFVAFQGHFPDYPVLPGVAILYLGWVVAEIFRNRRLDLLSVRKARFSKPIHPRDAVKVELLPLKFEDGGGQSFSVRVACGGETAARYELGVRPSGEGRA